MSESGNAKLKIAASRATASTQQWQVELVPQEGNQLHGSLTQPTHEKAPPPPPPPIIGQIRNSISKGAAANCNDVKDPALSLALTNQHLLRLWEITPIVVHEGKRVRCDCRVLRNRYLLCPDCTDTQIPRRTSSQVLH